MQGSSLDKEPGSVIIIGAGVIGLCTAYFLTEQGHHVTVIEETEEGNPGCSTGNAGMIVPSHFVPLASPGMVAYGLKMLFNRKSPFGFDLAASAHILPWAVRFWHACTPQHVQESAPVLAELNRRSRTLFQELQPKIGPFNLVNKGLLMLCRTEHGFHHEVANAKEAARLGLEAEPLSAKEVQERDPAIEMRTTGGVHFKCDSHLDPQQFINNLLAVLKEKGVKFCYRQRVVGFSTEGRTVRSVKLSEQSREHDWDHSPAVSEEISADHFVIAAGSWTQELGRRLHVNVPIIAGKGYSITLEHPLQLPELCSIAVEDRLAITPMNGRLRIAGTMELGKNRLSVNANRVQGILESFPKIFSAYSVADLQNQPVWSGLRPCTPDGVPIISKTPAWDNVVFNAGHAMMGLSLAPVSGEIAAALVSNTGPWRQFPAAEKLLSISRFQHS